MKQLITIMILLAVAELQAGESAYKIKVNSPDDVRKIAEFASIDSPLSGGRMTVYISDDRLSELFPYVSEVNFLAQLPSSSAKMISEKDDFLQNWNGYPTLPLYYELMSSFAAEHPDLCRLDTIGFTNKGRAMIFLNFTNFSNTKPRPSVMYESSIHGNELTGYVLMLRLIDYMLTQYGTLTEEGARIRRIIDSTDLWIMPLFNIDGAYPNTELNALDSKRTNAVGADLNRNFPEQWTDPVNTVTGRETETAAMMNFVFGKNFILSANFHDGSTVVNYPWDALPDGSYRAVESVCPDNLWFINLSNTYASLNSDMKNSEEFTGGITNGSMWYNVYGGRQDWIYSFEHCRETTIELCSTFLPGSDELVRQWDLNRESMIAYLEQAFYGISGTVTSAEDSKPLKAVVKIVQFKDADAVTDSSNGYYFRPLLGGTYDCIAVAEGFLPDTARNVSFASGDHQILNFTLKKAPKTSVQYSDPTLQEPYYFNGNIRFPEIADKEIKIDLFDMLGNKLVSTVVLPGQSSAGVGSLNAGIYFARIDSGSKIGIVKFAVR